MGRRGRKLFLTVVVAEHMEVAALLQTGKARRAGIRFGKIRDPRELRPPPIAYYDASVVQKFVGTGTATQRECMLLAELAPLRSDGS